MGSVTSLCYIWNVCFCLYRRTSRGAAVLSVSLEQAHPLNDIELVSLALYLLFFTHVHLLAAGICCDTCSWFILIYSLCNGNCTSFEGMCAPLYLSLSCAHALLLILHIRNVHF